MKINCMALCKVNIEIMMTGGLTALETLYGEHPKKLDSELGFPLGRLPFLDIVCPEDSWRMALNFAVSGY